MVRGGPDIVVVVVLLACNWGFRWFIVVLVVPLLAVLVRRSPADLLVLLVGVVLVLVLVALVLAVAEVLVVADGIIIIIILGSRRIIILAARVHPAIHPFVPRPMNWAIIIRLGTPTSLVFRMLTLVFLILLRAPPVSPGQRAGSSPRSTPGQRARVSVTGSATTTTSIVRSALGIATTFTLRITTRNITTAFAIAFGRGVAVTRLRIFVTIKLVLHKLAYLREGFCEAPSAKVINLLIIAREAFDQYLLSLTFGWHRGKPRILVELVEYAIQCFDAERKFDWRVAMFFVDVEPFKFSN